MSAGRLSARCAVALAALLLSTSPMASGFEEGMRLLDEYRDREALEVFRQAGHDGDVRALRMTGLMYLWGNVLYPGVPTRPELAVRWLRRAAQQGDRVARQWLARDYWVPSAADVSVDAAAATGNNR